MCPTELHVEKVEDNSVLNKNETYLVVQMTLKSSLVLDDLRAKNVKGMVLTDPNASVKAIVVKLVSSHKCVHLIYVDISDCRPGLV